MGSTTSGDRETGRAELGATRQALDGDRRRRAASEGSLPPTGQVAPAPRGSRDEAMKGENTSVQTHVVGGDQGVMLKGDQERIRRRNLEGRGGGATVHRGASNVAVI